MKITLAIVVLLIALLGISVFFFMSNEDTEQAATEPALTSTIAEPATTNTSSSSDEASESGDIVEIDMDSGNFFFAPNQIQANEGDTVIVNITSEGNHNFAIDEFNVDVDTPNATTTTITFVADKAGTYEFYCNIGSHRERGQKGTIVVN